MKPLPCTTCEAIAALLKKTQNSLPKVRLVKKALKKSR